MPQTIDRDTVLQHIRATHWSDVFRHNRRRQVPLELASHANSLTFIRWLVETGRLSDHDGLIKQRLAGERDAF